MKPAAEVHGLETVRADDVGEPGQITAQAVQHCLQARAAVADLTGGNPNVYYELSVRHGAQLPVVLIADERTKLPFDISQSRVIFFDHTDLESSGTAREKLKGQIGASLEGTPDNPILDGMRLAELKEGNVEEQTLALVMDRLQRLAVLTESIDSRLLSAEEPWMARGGSIEPDREIKSLRRMLDLAQHRREGLIRDEKDALSTLNDRAVGRNDPCWCGSGKKYKRCHGA